MLDSTYAFPLRIENTIKGAVERFADRHLLMHTRHRQKRLVARATVSSGCFPLDVQIVTAGIDRRCHHRGDGLREQPFQVDACSTLDVQVTAARSNGYLPR